MQAVVDFIRGVAIGLSGRGRQALDATLALFLLISLVQALDGDAVAATATTIIVWVSPWWLAGEHPNDEDAQIAIMVRRALLSVLVFVFAGTNLYRIWSRP